MPNVIVRGLSRADTQGKLHLGHLRFPCAIGRGGRRPKSGEGDGITPRGQWVIRQIFYRPDRIVRPRTALPLFALSPDMGWCDAPGDPNYNRMVRLPYAASHEKMWRSDRLYDLVAVLGYNDWPRARRRGSAIFLHLARSNYSPTEGCVSLSRRHMLMLLERLTPGSWISID